MNSSNSLRLVACGGTFDKHYDEIAGELGFRDSHLPAIVKRARLTMPVIVETLPLKDSLDMQDGDRARVLAACRAAPEASLVIVHGTDTMRETAHVLGPYFGSEQSKVAVEKTSDDAAAKTIVITGAMIPYAIENSDALFNLGFACACAQTLPPGVYIAMNGRVFWWDDVRKNREAGVFERT